MTPGGATNSSGAPGGASGSWNAPNSLSLVNPGAPDLIALSTSLPNYNALTPTQPYGLESVPGTLIGA